MIDGQVPGGETLQVGVSRLPPVDLNQMWPWIHEEENTERSGGGEGRDACLEDKWGGRTR